MALFESTELFMGLPRVVAHIFRNVTLSPAGMQTFRAAGGQWGPDLGMPGLDPVLDRFKAGAIANSLSIECASCRRLFDVRSLSIDLTSSDGEVLSEGRQFALGSLAECPFCQHSKMHLTLADAGSLSGSARLRDW